MLNDPALLDEMTEILTGAIGVDNLVPLPLGLEGDNFSEFSMRRPSAYLSIGGGPADKRGEVLPDLNHSPEFFFDERCLLVGFKIWRELILT